MQTISIDTGRIWLDVEGRGEVITFNPHCVRFRLALQLFLQELMEVHANTPSWAEDELQEFCRWCEDSIDKVFGDGTCRKALGRTDQPELYIRFMEAIEPYV